MTTSIFTDKAKTPDEKTLLNVVGDKADLLEEILNYINNEYDNIKIEWKHYGQKYGWQMKIFMKKRNLLFLLPFENDFRIAFVLGDKAVAACEKSELPKELIETIKNERKYMEGRGVRVDVRSGEDVNIIKMLLKIKVEN
ncbi:MAG: DUF3788 family protein [bacterium]|nr:DUF3788 family protein [bacterium]